MIKLILVVHSVQKSGDLVSYFYRKINFMRSVEFSNLEALETSQEDLSKRALVILDDYVGKGLLVSVF